MFIFYIFAYTDLLLTDTDRAEAGISIEICIKFEWKIKNYNNIRAPLSVSSSDKRSILTYKANINILVNTQNNRSQVKH